MTITSAKTNKYGPCSLNIQFEAGADFALEVQLTKGGSPWPTINTATFEACFSSTWNPGAITGLFTVTVVDVPTARVMITASKALIDAIQLPVSPAKLPAPNSLGKASRFTQLGGWTFTITQDGFSQRLIDGDVQLDRDPCQQ
jgi:hypothetical protein